MGPNNQTNFVRYRGEFVITVIIITEFDYIRTNSNINLTNSIRHKKSERKVYTLSFVLTKIRFIFFGQFFEVCSTPYIFLQVIVAPGDIIDRIILTTFTKTLKFTHYHLNSSSWCEKWMVDKKKHCFLHVWKKGVPQ